jgi:DHA1 family bicyclomycin/chloramphenicol resistance-like MFS transporter
VGATPSTVWATAIHIAASLGVAAAPDVTWLLIFRVLQGAGMKMPHDIAVV